MKNLVENQVGTISDPEEIQGAFDAAAEPLDMSKGEKMRTTALMLAIKYYTDTICKDADMYNAIVMRNGTMRPATSLGVINAALQFENFLLGKATNVEFEDEDAGGGRKQPSAAIEAKKE